MVILNKMYFEFKKYGIRELLYSILGKVTRDKKWSTYALIEKDKYYGKLSAGQLEKEIKELYKGAMENELDLFHPTLFTEKIQYIKLYGDMQIMQRLADKYLVREWVEEKIGVKYLIPLLGGVEQCRGN